MKIGNYEFSLKKFEHIESRSDETNCFGAILCVNGKPFADCGNGGCGGPTDVHIRPECRELGQEIEAFLKTQPKVQPEGHNFELELDLEYIVDDLVYKTLLEKERSKMMAKTKSNLVFKSPAGHYILGGWKKQTIESMLKHPQGPCLIKKKIAEELAKGYTLLNKNIPDELLPKNKGHEQA